MIETLLDSFFSERLNPVFLQSLQEYWVIVTEAKDQDPAQILSTQKNLLRFLFRHLFQSVYLKHAPKIKGKLFFVTSVRPDGLGDYFTTLKCAKIVKQAHPEADIHVVYTHQLPLPAITPSDYLLDTHNIHEFLETSDRPILEPVLEGKETLDFEIQLAEQLKEREEYLQDYNDILQNHGHNVESLAELISDCDRQIDHLHSFIESKNNALALYEEMKDSQAIIHISLALNTFENPVLASRSLYFSEAGNFQGIANYLHYNWFSMGMQPFEEGIFLRKTFSQSIVNDPKKECSLHLAYLPKIPEQRLIFIYLICLLQKEDRHSIEIVLPQVGQEEFLDLNPDWLAQQGIGEVVLVNKNSVEISLFKTGVESEKTLRLVLALPLPPSEFEEMMANCGPVVGCTGDSSLSDCLIAGKIPFYELRKHKLQTWQGLKELAEYLQLKDISNYVDTLMLYKEIEPEIVAEKLFVILCHAGFKEQWKKLLDFIHTYYCFEDALLSHVNRHVLHKEAPELFNLEEELIQKYFEGKITASEAFNTLALAVNA